MEWWEQLRAHFPALAERGYFFAGMHTPMATEVEAEFLRLVALWRDRIWRFEETEWGRQDEIQDLVGQILSCDPSRVVIADNTSHGMSLAATMVLARWARNGAPARNVVLHHACHPAGSYIWLNAVRLGAPLTLRWSEESSSPAHAALASLVDEDTLAVVATHVDHLTGERLDVGSVLPAARRAGAALLLDAAQTAGALCLAKEVDSCDFVAMPGYKWLFGPPGIGYLVVGRDWLEAVGPPFVGWASQRDMASMDPRRLDIADGGQGFRLGVPSYMILGATAAALRIAVEAEPLRVEDRIKVLTDRFIEGVEANGLPCLTPSTWQRRAGVTALPVSDPDHAMESVLRMGSNIGWEPGRIRVDIHAYNTEAEVDRLVESLSTYYNDSDVALLCSTEIGS